MRWLNRLRRRSVLGAPIGDAVLAVILAAFAFADTFFIDTFSGLDQWRGPRSINAVVMPLAALAITWRRRYPLAVLVVVCTAVDALGFAYGSTQASITVFTLAITVYSATAYGPSLPVALGVSAVGVFLRDAYDPAIHSFGERIWDWLFVGMFIGIGYATRLRQLRLSASEQSARAAEREQAARAEAAADQERQRIARELHDIVSHSLGLLVFQAGVGEQFVDADPGKAREAFRSIRLAGLEAVGEMGTILGLIRGDRSTGREPQPRVADIETLVRRARDTGVAVEFGVHGEAPVLPAAVELSIYRIVQEGLTNAIKHAPSASIRVDVRYRDDSVAVEIVNGEGATLLARGTGRGLIGLRERVAIFGGHLDVGPATDGGWRVAATLPVTR
ncbi:MAG TPA: histidine kinase [Micromonosporaceae bacterium]|jgi:signal transduction histidine kinase